MSFPSAAALARYQSVKVTTASPAQIVVMLYDGLLRYVREAREAMSDKNFARTGERIGRAQAVLEHLIASLDRAQSPTLCERLEALYAYAMQRLLEANLHQDVARLDEVVTLFAPLRDAWAEAAKQVAAAPK